MVPQVASIVRQRGWEEREGSGTLKFPWVFSSEVTPRIDLWNSPLKLEGKKKSNPEEPTSAQRASSWSLLQLLGWEKYYRGHCRTVEKDLVLRLSDRAKGSHCCYIDLFQFGAPAPTCCIRQKQQDVTTQSHTQNLTSGVSPGGGEREKNIKKCRPHVRVPLLARRDQPSLILLCLLIPQETETQLILAPEYQQAWLSSKAASIHGSTDS